jgi:hypothetical protein
MPLVAVFHANSELEANMVRELLTHHGVPALARCTDPLRGVQLPLPHGLAPEWGQVEVDAAQAGAAREIIAGFFSSAAQALPPEPEPGSG